MNRGDDISDEFKKLKDRLYGYALARLMNEDQAAELLTAVMSNASRSNINNEECLMNALRVAIREHFANKYADKASKTKCAKEVEAILAVPFISNVKLSNVHTKMLDDVSPDLFWEASRECLEMLHSVQADVYVLREMEDVSCNEISEMTGLAFEAVLELVYRGRMTFVECLLKRIDS